jgi:hypothetical protein
MRGESTQYIFTTGGNFCQLGTVKFVVRFMLECRFVVIRQERFLF